MLIKEHVGFLLFHKLQRLSEECRRLCVGWGTHHLPRPEDRQGSGGQTELTVLC